MRKMVLAVSAHAMDLGNLVEPGAQRLRHVGTVQEGQPDDGAGLAGHDDADLGQAVKQEEQLDQQWGVARQLDVPGDDLAYHRDTEVLHSRAECAEDE